MFMLLQIPRQPKALKLTLWALFKSTGLEFSFLANVNQTWKFNVTMNTSLICFLFVWHTYEIFNAPVNLDVVSQTT